MRSWRRRKKNRWSDGFSYRKAFSFRGFVFCFNVIRLYCCRLVSRPKCDVGGIWRITTNLLGLVSVWSRFQKRYLFWKQTPESISRVPVQFKSSAAKICYVFVKTGALWSHLQLTIKEFWVIEQVKPQCLPLLLKDFRQGTYYMWTGFDPEMNKKHFSKDANAFGPLSFVQQISYQLTTLSWWRRTRLAQCELNVSDKGSESVPKWWKRFISEDSAIWRNNNKTPMNFKIIIRDLFIPSIIGYFPGNVNDFHES